MAMTHRFLMALGPGGFHRLAYVQWGRADQGRVLICCHGLTQNGRYFDPLAAALEDAYRIACPDVPGRGDSDWLDSFSAYDYGVYLPDMAALIARLGVEEVDWVGTSMGGLIGMALAAQKNSPIKRLVLNDIGPFLPQAALERISSYTGTAPAFASVAEAEAYLRQVQVGMGDLEDDQWAWLAGVATRRRNDGAVVLAYDPAIGDALRAGDGPKDVDMWAYWDRITCPVLVVRGAKSDILLAETAAEMQVRGPCAQLVEIEGVGHAPPLISADQIALVRNWLVSEAR